MCKEAFFLLSQCKGRRLAHSAAFRLHVNEPKDNVFQKEKINPKMNFRRASPLWRDTLHIKQTELGRAKFKTFLAWFGLQGSYLLLSHIIKRRSETGSGITEQTGLETSEDTCPINRNHWPIQNNTHVLAASQPIKAEAPTSELSEHYYFKCGTMIYVIMT